MQINFEKLFEKQSLLLNRVIGVAMIGVIGMLDFLTGYELAFSVFYVFPIAIIAWVSGRRWGVLTSLISAGVWYAADDASGHHYSNALIPLWNTLIRLSFFLIIALLLSRLKSALQREKELARIDGLTGAANSRLFYDLAQNEINRLQRYPFPFTLAYIDLDNFKKVNDQFGHLEGDRVLCKVVDVARGHLRKSDVIARLGGDEFALILPQTSAQSAPLVINKIRDELLVAMRECHWPITFSIGVLTCTVQPSSVNELVKMADGLMYAVKRNNKNSVNYAEYSG